MSLKVKHFILPAADEAESIWTKRFGFSKITSEQVGSLAIILLFQVDFKYIPAKPYTLPMYPVRS